MATETGSNPPSESPRLHSFQVGGCPALGLGSLAMDLEPRQTILVGKNGAGKSAIMEALFQGLKHPFSQRQTGPADFRISIETGERGLLHYSYKWEPPTQVSPGADPDAPVAPNWTEKCWWEGMESEPAWITAEGKAIYGGVASAPINLARGTSLLQFGSELAEQKPFVGTALNLVNDVCARSRRVSAGVPRDDRGRSEMFFQLRIVQDRRTWMTVGLRPNRVSNMLRTLIRWHDSDKSQFEHLTELAKSLGAVLSMDVHTFKTTSESSESEEIGSVLFDGVNAGLAADGTLRVIETLIQLVSSQAGLILIEEPETAIHPGLLSKLLNVVDSYTADRQVVFSTHSPMVVSHAKPGALRLIERVGKESRARKLSTSESQLVGQYLLDEGNLGEFIFSGGLDDEP